MEDNQQSHTPEPSKTTGTGSFMYKPSAPVADLIMKPIENPDSWLKDYKIRKLYIQASSQQWFAPTKLNFETSLQEMDPEVRRVWIRFQSIFYTLEKMGLNVIENMTSKAVRKLKSEEAAFYLAAQGYDESRHVFVVENYLKMLGAPPKYDWKYHVLGQAASMGFCRVENWLFSTLFSENFASAFLRRSKNANIDPFGAEMCKNLMIDESRHLHFLHIVLPDIMDRLSLFGKTYVKSAQYFIMKFTESVSGALDEDAAIVGLDRRALLEEVFENMEKAYEGFGVSRKWLWFPKVSPARKPLITSSTN